MRQTCDHCGRRYDDEYHWTLCPHNPLEAGPEPGDYCRRHDLFGPCPLCAKQQPEPPDAAESEGSDGKR